MLRRSKQIKKAIAGTVFSGSLSSKISSSFDPCANKTPPTLLTPTTVLGEYLYNDSLSDNIYVTPALDTLNIKFRDAPRSKPDKKFAINFPNAVNMAGLITSVYYFPAGRTINDVVYKQVKYGDKCSGWDGPYINDKFVHMEKGNGIGNKTEAEALHHVIKNYDGYNPIDPLRKYSLYIYVEPEYRSAESFAIYIP